MKRFVYAALAYLGLAGLFGMLNGMAESSYFAYFAHTHFNLLGFMSMMIYGIGYFILPRFNGSDLRFPNWVKAHFWLGNVSLVGMVLFRGLSISTGSDLYSNLFIVSAAVQLITIFMFIVNVWLSLSPPKVTEEPLAQTAPAATARTSPSAEQTPPPAQAVAVTPNSRIAELIDLKSSIKDLLIREGLASLGMPGHIDKVRQMGVTLGMAANNHGLDILHLITRIEQELARPEASTGAESVSEAASKINPDLLIGDVIAQYPQSRDVFQKHFGSGCFDCPGQAYESIDMACRMHGVEPEQFMEELKVALNP
ncbi:MAG: DUF1858 domain-containing protein [bacterium]|nr:DUF1858 domain-containing protein [bacterium]